MTSDRTARVRRVIDRFEIDGSLVSVSPVGSGHIHDTWVSCLRSSVGTERFVHQRINTEVFHDPTQVMENIDRVTKHLRKKIIVEGGDPRRETLTVVPARAGGSLVQDDDGGWWRTYLYIERARAYDFPQGEAHIRSVGRAFAKFQRQMEDLPGPPLHETIPGFGDTRARYDRFEEVVRQDPCGRLQSVQADVDFACERESLTSLIVDLLAQGTVPERIIHFDTKLNNVLIDEETNREVCVIDLDTVMPGTILYDFGDAVHRAVCREAKDDRDLSQVVLDLDLFRQLAEGYLEVHRDWLVPAEIDHLVDASRAMVFTIGLRFLTDHLLGDRYFKIERPAHNLDRCRVQFELVRQIEAQSSRMREVTERRPNS